MKSRRVASQIRFALIEALAVADIHLPFPELAVRLEQNPADLDPH